VLSGLTGLTREEVSGRRGAGKRRRRKAGPDKQDDEDEKVSAQLRGPFLLLGGVDEEGGARRSSVSGVEPAEGSRAGSELVKLSGFFPQQVDPAAVVVRFGEHSRRPLRCSAREIAVSSPPAPVGKREVELSVSFDSGASYCTPVRFVYQGETQSSVDKPGSHMFCWGSVAAFAAPGPGAGAAGASAGAAGRPCWLERKFAAVPPQQQQQGQQQHGQQQQGNLGRDEQAASEGWLGVRQVACSDSAAVVLLDEGVVLSFGREPDADEANPRSRGSSIASVSLSTGGLLRSSSALLSAALGRGRGEREPRGELRWLAAALPPPPPPPAQPHPGASGLPSLRQLVVTVAAGAEHFCAVTSRAAGSRLFAWGDNCAGQLGVGPGEPAAPAPRLVRVGEQGDLRVLHVACGPRATACVALSAFAQVSLLSWGAPALALALGGGVLPQANAKQRPSPPLPKQQHHHHPAQQHAGAEPSYPHQETEWFPRQALEVRPADLSLAPAELQARGVLWSASIERWLVELEQDWTRTGAALNLAAQFSDTAEQIAQMRRLKDALDLHERLKVSYADEVIRTLDYDGDANETGAGAGAGETEEEDVALSETRSVMAAIALCVAVLETKLRGMTETQRAHLLELRVLDLAAHEAREQLDANAHGDLRFELRERTAQIEARRRALLEAVRDLAEQAQDVHLELDKMETSRDLLAGLLEDWHAAFAQQLAAAAQCSDHDEFGVVLDLIEDLQGCDVPSLAQRTLAAPNDCDLALADAKLFARPGAMVRESTPEARGATAATRAASSVGPTNLAQLLRALQTHVAEIQTSLDTFDDGADKPLHCLLDFAHDQAQLKQQHLAVLAAMLADVKGLLADVARARAGATDTRIPSFRTGIKAISSPLA
jgi:hypothetical protein